MKAFGSFTVDHNFLRPGVYVSRRDELPQGVVYTIDIRVCQPYKDDVINNVTLHSIEHIVATKMESVCQGAIKKLYFGPMGCQTGFYAVVFVSNDLLRQSQDMAENAIILKLSQCFKGWDGVVPFNSKMECGNCNTLAVLPDEIYVVNHYLSQINGMFSRCVTEGRFDKYPETIYS